MQRRSKTYLFHMSLEVHVNTLSCFAIMSLHMFSSKAQECVHAHIQASLWLLRTRTNGNNEQQHEVNNHRHNSTFHRTSFFILPDVREPRTQRCTSYCVLYPHTSILDNSVFSLLAKSISQKNRKKIISSIHSAFCYTLPGTSYNNPTQVRDVCQWFFKHVFKEPVLHLV